MEREPPRPTLEQLPRGTPWCWVVWPALNAIVRVTGVIQAMHRMPKRLATNPIGSLDFCTLAQHQTQ